MDKVIQSTEVKEKQFLDILERIDYFTQAGNAFESSVKHSAGLLFTLV